MESIYGAEVDTVRVLTIVTTVGYCIGHYTPRCGLARTFVEPIHVLVLSNTR